MKNIIDSYMKNLTKSTVNDLALKNDIHLSNEELDFTYHFLKTKYKEVLRDKQLDLTSYKTKFSEENFEKITDLINKYANYL